MKKLIRITTIATSLDSFVGKQLSFLNKDYDVIALANGVKILEKLSKTQNIKVLNVDMKREITPIYDFISLTKLVRVFLQEKPYIVHAPSMLKTATAKKIKYNADLKLGEDVDFLSRYLSLNDCMYICPECLYFYSEFDSVSLDKIKQTYLNELQVFLFPFKIKSIKILAKLICSYIYHPFYDLNSILKRRGVLASEGEYIVFLELLNRLK